MAISIRVSYDTFRELREDGAYYIDKTEVIEEYLINNFEKAMLFTRPRRFGKTITMTMIRDFLDIRQDSREIFKGLKIMECEKAVTEYMNQYPVVFITLKDIFGTDFDSILQSLRIAISKLCEDNRFLLENEESIDEVNKELFNALWRRKADQADTEQGLELVCQLLSRHYGKKVYVIIDEYDVPMAKALGTPYYDKVRDMIEHTLSYVCKTNSHIKAVLMTGCLYTVKNSTYQRKKSVDIKKMTFHRRRSAD